ncbi:MAG: hypothetical protein SFW67_28460 [Myxococcaceae bacterium]|nr:hypothetical protein [Myxococcaceae bacterium]
MNSLCNLPQCTNPETCALCDIIRRPRPLSARDIARLQLTPARVTVIGDNAQLRARVDSMPAVQTRAGALAHITGPAVTAPMPAPVALAPAPTPKAPPVVTIERANGVREAFDPSAPLVAGDWLGLSARVDAGVLTARQAEDIGRKWIEMKGGATATA